MAGHNNDTRVVCYTKETLPKKYHGYIHGYAAFRRNCGKAIDKHYLAKAFERADYIVIAMKPSNQIKHLPDTRGRAGQNVAAGFAFLQRIVNRTGIHVDLICSNNNTGKLILKRIEKKASELGLEFINLNAIDVAVQFYRRNNYKYVKSENNPCRKTDRKDKVVKKDGDGHTWAMGKCVLSS